MTWNYKALALGAGIAAALALSACGKRNNVTGAASSETATAPATESAAPAASGAMGTMGAPESGAPAASSAPANPGG